MLMEMKKQMFDKQMFAGPCRENGILGGLWPLGPLWADSGP